MTDGGARLIEVMKLKDTMATTYNRLTSKDPSSFWTSGQWMREREVVDLMLRDCFLCPPGNGDRYCLHGYKWFSSASDSH
uniref:Uncharacterized protein n=1 Tax=Amphimedon queenslandica TaxID=400682 RepID=A0A1X7TIV8_AMPQE